MNVPDVTGDSAAVVAAVLNLFDDAAARLRQCQAGDERVLPLKRTRRLEVAEGGVKRVCVGECSCKLGYQHLGVRLSTTKRKVHARDARSLLVCVRCSLSDFRSRYGAVPRRSRPQGSQGDGRLPIAHDPEVRRAMRGGRRVPTRGDAHAVCGRRGQDATLR